MIKKIKTLPRMKSRNKKNLVKVLLLTQLVKSLMRLSLTLQCFIAQDQLLVSQLNWPLNSKRLHKHRNTASQSCQSWAKSLCDRLHIEALSPLPRRKSTSSAIVSTKLSKQLVSQIIDSCALLRPKSKTRLLLVAATSPSVPTCLTTSFVT